MYITLKVQYPQSSTHVVNVDDYAQYRSVSLSKVASTQIIGEGQLILLYQMLKI